MRAFVDDCILHSGETIEDHSSGSSLHVVNRGTNERSSNGSRNRDLVKCTQYLRHVDVVCGNAGVVRGAAGMVLPLECGELDVFWDDFALDKGPE